MSIIIGIPRTGIIIYDDYKDDEYGYESYGPKPFISKKGFGVGLGFAGNINYLKECVLPRITKTDIQLLNQLDPDTNLVFYEDSMAIINYRGITYPVKPFCIGRGSKVIQFSMWQHNVFDAKTLLSWMQHDKGLPSVLNYLNYPRTRFFKADTGEAI